MDIGIGRRKFAASSDITAPPARGHSVSVTESAKALCAQSLSGPETPRYSGRDENGIQSVRSWKSIWRWVATQDARLAAKRIQSAASSRPGMPANHPNAPWGGPATNAEIVEAGPKRARPISIAARWFRRKTRWRQNRPEDQIERQAKTGKRIICKL